MLLRRGPVGRWVLRRGSPEVRVVLALRGRRGEVVVAENCPKYVRFIGYRYLYGSENGENLKVETYTDCYVNEEKSVQTGVADSLRRPSFASLNEAWF